MDKTAFPQPWHPDAVWSIDEHIKPQNGGGLTRRELLAALAMQAWITGPCGGETLDDYDGDDRAFREHQNAVAQTAIGYADALIHVLDESK